MTMSAEDIQGLHNSSLKILGDETIDAIYIRLASYKVLLSEQRLHRDWRGVADYVGLDIAVVRSSRLSPIEYCFAKWIKKDGTIKQLLDVLEKMDRYDVIDDCMAELWKDYERSVRVIPRPICFDESGLLTKDDVNNVMRGGSFEIYSALVLYADEDIDFVKEMVAKLEGEHQLKLCILDRELLGGLILEFKAIAKIIRERCTRVIVVLSPAFLESDTNNFFTIFAQSLAIEQKRRIVIPCKIQPCEKPSTIAVLHSLDHYRTNGYWDYWGKLAASIKYDGRTVNGKLAIASKQGPVMQEETEVFKPVQFSPQKNIKERYKSSDDVKIANLPDVPTDSPGSRRSLKGTFKKLFKAKRKRLPAKTL